MKMNKPVSSPSHLPGACLKKVSKKTVTTTTERPSQPGVSFSFKDVTKAIENFNTAVANAQDGDKTALAICDLTKEALLSVLNNICGHHGLPEKYRVSLG